MALMWPVLGSTTLMPICRSFAAGYLLMFSTAAVSAACWIAGSMVVVTVRPPLNRTSVENSSCSRDFT
ncbi:Uncharacterised protein [Collinsella intestinalis]|nr:Uncharacterised protein [Collinsella intestinalis]